jgi:hypothetical protein
MSELLKEYIELLTEATVRPARQYYGANITKSGSFFQTFVNDLLKNRKAAALVGPQLKAMSSDLNAIKELIDDKFPNRFIAKNIRETKNSITLQILLISRAWSGIELKVANKGAPPAEFESGIPVSQITLELNKNVPWLVAKQEELTAETNALDTFNASAFGDGVPKTVVVKSSQSSKMITFKNVNSLVKNPDKAGHADFYFTDTKGQIIKGSGISHKAKGATDKSVAERYAGVTRLMQNLIANQGKFSEGLEEKKLLEAAENAVDSGLTVTLIQDFIKEASDFYKKQALSGVELAGFIKSIDTKKYADEIETMMYGPDKNDCTMLVISRVDGMSLKKSERGNTYEFDVGTDGKVFIRPDIPSDPAYKPIFVCRYGSGGSKFTFSDQEYKRLMKMRNVPSYVKIEKGMAYIPVRLYISPAIRSPSKDAPDIAVKSKK